ncbi:MAG TPA: S41 family peptidase, partial [Gemmatimonadaceae bacterium]|nr:S41 family peptidase [Gemmatimonadaceae bacterium]
MKRFRVVFVLGAVVIASLAATSIHFYQQSVDGQRLFMQVAGIVNSRFVDSLGASGVYEKAASGLVEQLHDPYSELMTPKDVEGFARAVEGKYGGIGATVESRTGKRTFITKVYPNTPAEAAGVIEGDQIIAVDGVSMVGLEMGDVTSKTKGDPGTKVNVTFQREGVPEPITLTLTRALVRIPAVPFAFMAEPGIGYVPLQTFNETSAREVTDAVMRLRAEGAKSYVLDMRGNGGGILQQALAISSLFLKPKQAIVSVRARSGVVEADSAMGPRLDGEFPLVVLTDDGSASATEIVAGALQDHDRALVIGERSFGKGLVQQTFPLDGGYLLKVTTGKWYTPSGRSIHRDRTLRPDGRFVETPVDTVKTPLPRFKSDAGRTVV